jgi:hypothetical protein
MAQKENGFRGIVSLLDLNRSESSIIPSSPWPCHIVLSLIRYKAGSGYSPRQKPNLTSLKAYPGSSRADSGRQMENQDAGVSSYYMSA